MYASALLGIYERISPNKCNILIVRPNADYLVFRGIKVNSMTNWVMPFLPSLLLRSRRRASSYELCQILSPRQPHAYFCL
jgi:hypothetical protein